MQAEFINDYAQKQRQLAEHNAQTGDNKTLPPISDDDLPIATMTDDEKRQIQEAWQVRHDEVLKAGGLHIIGSERHESRRIDNQLRGRAGRQGDPGQSRFFLSLEDDLMRIFAGERVVNMMRAMGLKEDEAIEHKMVSRSIENAQGKVEARDFDARKSLLKYDDVANDQRKVIYSQRDDLLANTDLKDSIESMHKEVYSAMIDEFVPRGSVDDQWNIDGLEDEIEEAFRFYMPINDWLDADSRLDEDGLRQKSLILPLLATMNADSIWAKSRHHGLNAILCSKVLTGTGKNI